MANIYNNAKQTDLTELTNAELLERYERLPYKPPEVEAARLVIIQNQNGFAPVADRQVVIDYLIQEEAREHSSNNLKFRRINGGKRRKSKRSRRGRKSRKGRKSRR